MKECGNRCERVYEVSVEKCVGVWKSVRGSVGRSVGGGLEECAGKCVGVWGEVTENVGRGLGGGVKECMGWVQTSAGEVWESVLGEREGERKCGKVWRQV